MCPRGTQEHGIGQGKQIEQMLLLYSTSVHVVEPQDRTAETSNAKQMLMLLLKLGQVAARI